MTPVLEARDVRKSFPGVQALKGVSLHVGAGEVLALVGENGAGKSTLMKILAGVETPDAGQLLLDGRPVSFRGVPDALAAGVCLIHQELYLADNLDVAANIFLGRERTSAGPLALVGRARLAAEARPLIERLGIQAGPHDRVGDLPLGQQQLVEIARALSRSARVIIMDEPTSSLTQRETDRLMQVIDGLRRDGVAVIYISHRLAEVKRIADRVTVLRDGANAGELAREEVSHDSLVRLMVGRDLKQLYPRTADRQPGPVRLEVRNLLYPGGSDTPMSFALRAGEVVGVAGLVGAGRTELAETLFGVRRRRAGEVLLDGTPVRLGTPADAVAAGVLLVPEDRRLFGLVLDFPVRTNLSLPSLGRLNTLGIVSRAREKTLARDLIARLRVKTPSASQAVGLLSGGNQQKVVLGKWLARDPKVLILDEPTRGVDVGARSEIYAIMDDLANQGVAVLMISSDLEEVLGMSDRVLVLHEGRLAGELARSELGEEAVMHLATGGKR